MKKTITLILFIAVLSSCSHDTSFLTFSENFQLDYKQQFKIPSEPLVIITNEKIKEDLDFCTSKLEVLATFDTAQLSLDNRITWQNTSTKLKKKIGQIQMYQTHPDRYNIYTALQQVAKQEEWSLSQRLTMWQKQLALSSLFYQSAKENLEVIDVKNAKETWEAHIKTFMFLNENLRKVLTQSDWTNEQKKDFALALEAAEFAVKDYIAFCRSAVLNR